MPLRGRSSKIRCRCAWSIAAAADQHEDRHKATRNAIATSISGRSARSNHKARRGKQFDVAAAHLAISEQGCPPPATPRTPATFCHKSATGPASGHRHECAKDDRRADPVGDPQTPDILERRQQQQDAANGASQSGADASRFIWVRPARRDCRRRGRTSGCELDRLGESRLGAVAFAAGRSDHPASLSRADQASSLSPGLRCGRAASTRPAPVRDYWRCAGLGVERRRSLEVDQSFIPSPAQQQRPALVVGDFGPLRRDRRGARIGGVGLVPRLWPVGGDAARIPCPPGR